MRKALAFFFSLALLLGLAVPALAADSAVTWKGGDTGLVLSGDDLFANFKNLVPGDELTQTVTVKNESEENRPVRLYLTAAAPEDDAEGQALLEQLTVTVKNGDEDVTSALADGKVRLASLRPGDSAVLTATVKVPLTLGNEFANKSAEIDWTFTAENRLPGDVNLNGVVDASDVRLLLMYVNEDIDTLPDLDLANINRVGGIDASDVRVLLLAVNDEATDSLPPLD